MRHDEPSPGRRLADYRPHARTLRAIWSWFVNSLIVPARRGIVLLRGRHLFRAAFVVGRRRAWSSRRRRSSGSIPISAESAGSARHEDAADLVGPTHHDGAWQPGSDPGRSSKLEQADATPTPPASPEASVDAGLKKDTASSATRGNREKRRGRRRALPEPPAPRFVMVAPGRYVRVEEPAAVTEVAEEGGEGLSSGTMMGATPVEGCDAGPDHAELTPSPPAMGAPSGGCADPAGRLPEDGDSRLGQGQGPEQERGTGEIAEQGIPEEWQRQRVAEP